MKVGKVKCEKYEITALWNWGVYKTCQITNSYLSIAYNKISL